MEDPVKYKSDIIPTISDTVYALLADLSSSTIEKLLSDETMEELVLNCKRRFNEEFDLYFPSLGLAGASEIAWHETFSIFNDDVWSDVYE